MNEELEDQDQEGGEEEEAARSTSASSKKGCMTDAREVLRAYTHPESSAVAKRGVCSGVAQFIEISILSP